jgi:hypothetical protein
LVHAETQALGLVTYGSVYEPYEQESGMLG